MSPLTYKSPLYIQLREVLRSKIEEGEYPPGTTIPSEAQLAETYGLNRQSVRSAVAALEYEGLLKSVQGRGVFVVGEKIERDMETLDGYHQTMRDRSRDPETRVLIKAVRRAGPYYSRVLQIQPDDDVWYIRRVDSTDGEPVGLEEIYIPVEVLPHLDETDIRVFSIYEAYKWAGIHPDIGKQVLRITRLDAAAAKLLGIPEEQAVMECSSLTKDSTGRIIEFARNYVRNDKASFSVHYYNQPRRT